MQIEERRVMLFLEGTEADASNSTWYTLLTAALQGVSARVGLGRGEMTTAVSLSVTCAGTWKSAGS